MAWNSERDVSEPTDYCIINTPSPPCYSANIDKQHISHSADDSGYLTELKPAFATPTSVEQCVYFPPLNLELSEDKTGQENGRIPTQLNACPLYSDTSADYTDHSLSHSADDSGYLTELKPALVTPTFVEQCGVYFPPLDLELSEEKTGPECDYTDQSLANTDHVWRLTLSDETSIYSPPDAVDQLPSTGYTMSQGCSFTDHSSRGSVLKDDPIILKQSGQTPHSSGSSCVDFISQLSCMPNVVAVILRHVPDGDLCRLQLFSFRTN